METSASHSAEPLSRSLWAAIPVRDSAVAMAESDENAVGFYRCVSLRMTFAVLSSITRAMADANDRFYLRQRLFSKHMRRILGSGLASEALHPCHDQKRVLDLDPNGIEPCVLEVCRKLFAS